MKKTYQVLCLLTTMVSISACSKKVTSDATVTPSVSVSPNQGQSVNSIKQTLLVGINSFNPATNSLNLETNMPQGATGSFSFKAEQSGRIHFSMSSMMSIGCDLETLPLTATWVDGAQRKEIKLPVDIDVIQNNEYVLELAVGPNSCDGLYTSFFSYWDLK